MAPPSETSNPDSPDSAASHITVTPSKHQADVLLLASDSVSPSPSPAKSATSTPRRGGGRGTASALMEESTPTTSVQDSHTGSQVGGMEKQDTITTNAAAAGAAADSESAATTAGAAMENDGRRSKRARASVATYDLKKLSAAQQLEDEHEEQLSKKARRDVSGLTGRTLVGAEEDEYDEAEMEKRGDAIDWEAEADADLIAMGAATATTSSNKVSRKPSVKDRVKKAAGKVGSVLGKRSREVVEAGKSKLGMNGDVKVDDKELKKTKEERLLAQLDTGPKGYLDEIDLDAIKADEEIARPAKRVKTNGQQLLKEVAQASALAPLKTKSNGKRIKKWLDHGLYTGQETDVELTAKGKEKNVLQKTRPGSSDPTTGDDAPPQVKKPQFPPDPRSSFLDNIRDFKLPYNIFAPSYRKGDEKPKDWTKINRNRIVGEAKDLWEKEAKLPESRCVCRPPVGGNEQGCDDNCWNRDMEYECNESNCALTERQCSNRAFARLAARTKKGGAFDIGVEVVKTNNRGFGVRSCREFKPGQIIMEYTGEIVSEEECERRMHEEYAGKANYYLMALQRGLIIDGTKGSMARFINHSCAPNCTVKMVKVNGTPRMGVFAGEEGVLTGEELSYDYNFDNFGENRQVCYCGAPNCRGFLSKRLNAAEKKAAEREEKERLKRVAEEQEAKRMEEEQKRDVKAKRGSGWRGWVTVAEVKETLMEEKKRKEEEEKNSSRARRMAARRGGSIAATTPAAAAAAAPVSTATIAPPPVSSATIAPPPVSAATIAPISTATIAPPSTTTTASALSAAAAPALGTPSATAASPAPAPAPTPVSGNSKKRKSIEIANDEDEALADTTAGAIEELAEPSIAADREPKRPNKLAKKNPPSTVSRSTTSRPSSSKRGSTTTTKTTVKFPNLSSKTSKTIINESTNSPTEDTIAAPAPAPPLSPAAALPHSSLASTALASVGNTHEPAPSAPAPLTHEAKEEEGSEHRQLLHEDRACSKQHDHQTQHALAKVAEDAPKTADGGGKPRTGSGYLRGLGQSVVSAFAKKGGLGGRDDGGKQGKGLRQSTLSFGRK